MESEHFRDEGVLVPVLAFWDVVAGELVGCGLLGVVELGCELDGWV